MAGNPPGCRVKMSRLGRNDRVMLARLAESLSGALLPQEGKGGRLFRMEDILELCKDMETVSFAPGEVLMAEGETSGCLYVLLSGKVEVTKEEVEVTEIDQPGSFFGELSILLGKPHPATVRAVDVVVCHVSRPDKEFLVEHPRIGLAVAELLASRLTGMLSYLVDLKSQYEDRKDHLGMVDEVLMHLSHRVPKKG